MKKNLSTLEAIKLLMRDEYAKWSYEAAQTIVEYYEELERQSCGTEIEFDSVAIRCEWSEFHSYEELHDEYYVTAKNEEREEKLTRQEFLQWVENSTDAFFKLDNEGYVLRQF